MKMRRRALSQLDNATTLWVTTQWKGARAINHVHVRTMPTWRLLPHVTLFTVPRGTRRSSWLVRTFIILKCCWKHYIKVSISLRHFIKGQGKLLSKTQSTNTGEQFIFYDTFSRDLRDLRAIQLCIIQIRLFTRTLVLVHITITM